MLAMSQAGSAASILPHFFLINNPVRDNCSSLQFKDEKTKAWRSQLSCPELQGQKATGLELRLKLGWV